MFDINQLAALLQQPAEQVAMQLATKNPNIDPTQLMAQLSAPSVQGPSGAFGPQPGSSGLGQMLMGQMPPSQAGMEMPPPPVPSPRGMPAPTEAPMKPQPPAMQTMMNFPHAPFNLQTPRQYAPPPPLGAATGLGSAGMAKAASPQQSDLAKAFGTFLMRGGR
jgi:hypothetical protein